MKTDLYTNVVLTVIAGLLAVNLFSSASNRTVHAQGHYWISKVIDDGGGKLAYPFGNLVTGTTIVGFSCTNSTCFAVGR